jgi:hypothetical protein
LGLLVILLIFLFREMSFKGSFSFRNDRILQLSIGDNVYIRIERVGFAVARLYFVDEGAAEVDIPDNLSVIDLTNGNAVVQPLLNNQYFVLAWSDNYSVLMNGNPIMGLANQRQWAVSGPGAAQIQVLEL